MSQIRNKKIIKTFLACIRSGLWEKKEQFDPNETIDYHAILQIAQVQSVVGIVAVGIDISDCRIPLIEKLKFIGLCQLIEQRNISMNRFVAKTVKRMKDNGIESLLVKGQGIAQCYARPLLRTSGDVDFFFSLDDYPFAVDLFSNDVSEKVHNAKYTKSFGVQVEEWLVELHGTLRSSLSSKVDKEIDEVQKDVFCKREFRVWRNDETEVHLPDVNSDLFLLFTHFVRHFYKGGISIRQLCDWCRLLWTYRFEIDTILMEKRLRKAGLLNEWKAFAALTVDSLGMPVEAMPLYDADARWRKKGDEILDFIFKKDEPNKIKDTVAIAKIFPWNTLCFLPSIIFKVNQLKIKERIIHYFLHNE